jgi:glutathione S-transferase
MGSCHTAVGSLAAKAATAAARVDEGPWPHDDFINAAAAAAGDANGGGAVPEVSHAPPANDIHVREAVRRMCRHRGAIQMKTPLGAATGDEFDAVLRAALTNVLRHGGASYGGGGAGGGNMPLVTSSSASSSSSRASVAAALRHLRDRVNVPRDMSLFAARRLRHALETTAAATAAGGDGGGGGGGGGGVAADITKRHRRDQDPAPFVAASKARAAH